jgi:hypothetical protein
MLSVISVIAEVFSIWFVVALIGALSFGAFATSQKKMAEQAIRRRPRS